MKEKNMNEPKTKSEMMIWIKSGNCWFHIEYFKSLVNTVVLTHLVPLGEPQFAPFMLLEWPAVAWRH